MSTKKQATLERFFERAGIPRHAWSPQLEQVPESGNMREIVAEYCETLPARIAQGHGLVLTGGVGIGKTSSLALIAKALPVGPLAVKFTTAANLFGKLHRRAQQSREELVLLEDITEAECSLLLLDDLCREYRSPFALSQFEEVMELRHAHRRATCVTTNVSAEDLRGVPEMERIFDRWREVNIFVAVDADTPSQRRAITREDWRAEENDSEAELEHRQDLEAETNDPNAT